jgi:hypothetical protein
MKFKIPTSMFNEISETSWLEGNIFYSYKNMAWCAEVTIGDMRGLGFFENDEDVYRMITWIPKHLLKEMKEVQCKEKRYIHINIPREIVLSWLKLEEIN